MDHSVFEEDASEEYKAILAKDESRRFSAQATEGETNQFFSSTSYITDHATRALVSALNDTSLPSAAARLDKAHSILLELQHLDSAISPHPAFAHAALAAAEDALQISASISEKGVKGKAKETDIAAMHSIRARKMQQALDWLSLSPSVVHAPKAVEANEKLAFTLRKTCHLLLQTVQAPQSASERHLLCLLAAVLIEKGCARIKLLKLLLNRAFTLPPELQSMLLKQARERQSAGGVDMEKWHTWNVNVLTGLEHIAQKLPDETVRSGALAAIESVAMRCAKARTELRDPGGDVWRRLVKGTVIGSIRKWKHRIWLGGTSAITQDLFAIVLQEKKKTSAEAAKLLDEVTRRNIEKRYPSRHEVSAMLASCIEHAGQDVQKLQELYTCWVGNVKSCLGQPETNVSYFEARMPHALVPAPPREILLMHAEALRSSPKSIGFDMFLSAFSQLSRTSPEAFTSDRSLAHYSRTILQDMLALDMAPKEHEWSMILNGFIAEGASAAASINLLALHLKILPDAAPSRASPLSIANNKNADPTLRAALEHFQHKVSAQPASLFTRIAALQACLHVRNEQGGRLMVHAQGFFDALWDEVLRVEGRQGDGDRHAALAEFLKQASRNQNNTSTDAPARTLVEPLDTAAPRQITLRAILASPRAIRVMQSYLELFEWWQARRLIGPEPASMISDPQELPIEYREEELEEVAQPIRYYATA